MIIYRIEHPSDGNGPYGHGEGPNVYEAPQKITAWSWNKRNPTLNNAGNYERLSKGWKCAFSSPEDLYRWFCNKHVRSWLISQGFIVQAYDIDEKHINHDRKQIVFNTKHARPIDCGLNL